MWYDGKFNGGLLRALNKPSLWAIPLGGLGEFGMNMLALRYRDDIIVIDAGMMFPEAEPQVGARHCAHARSRRPHRRPALYPGRAEGAHLRHAVHPRPGAEAAG